ncbi:FliO/MopB family protein [Anaerosporobacter sp.]|uniref:FliO/MopB family protein n=1 Tax=Anaerosporobacter sp. TaxID=1872529 RepID=UPI00286F1625|nr:flagellar biosynthetic protein FliO [Anaerosporobacter sp.]
MTSNIYLFQGSSTIRNIAELFGLLLVFALILVLAYFTSKWIGKTGAGMTTKNRNITIVETLKLSQTKYLQIIKVTDKYIVIAVSKDNVEYLTEIDGEQLVASQEEGEQPSFKDILSKIKSNASMKSHDNISSNDMLDSEFEDSKKENKKDENDV